MFSEEDEGSGSSEICNLKTGYGLSLVEKPESVTPLRHYNS